MRAFNFKTKKRRKDRGFTLVETLVAISILSLSILASFGAVQNGIKSSGVSKDQITAFFLAQETIEFIKNIRDENALLTLSSTPTHWLHGFAEAQGDPCFPGKVCMIDSNAKTITYCGVVSGSCPNLNQNSTTGLYGYTAGWVVSRYKREVEFQIINADEVMVTVNILWTDGTVSRSFEVKQLLFNHG